MDELPPGARLWLAGLLREQAFWQVVTMVVLLALLIVLGPHLGLGITSASPASLGRTVQGVGA